jgi:hypothetical protein
MDKVISSVYNDISGFGSMNNTYKEAKLKDENINMAHVKSWYKHNVEYKTKYGGQNSYVAKNRLKNSKLISFSLTI